MSDANTHDASMSVSLSSSEWEAVINALGQYPYAQVHGLIGKIASQLDGEKNERS